MIYTVDISSSKNQGSDQEYLENKEIRKYVDGTPFMFSYESIPTFDSGNRERDSACHLVVYADED